jgi:hypothetical protein
VVFCLSACGKQGRADRIHRWYDDHPRKDKAMIEQLSDKERQTIVAILISTVQRTYGDQARARVNAVLAKISGTDKRIFVTNGEAAAARLANLNAPS